MEENEIEEKVNQVHRFEYIKIKIELVACPFFSYTEKEIISEIISLSDLIRFHNVCSYTNKRLARRHRTTEDTVSKCITKATRLGFLTYRDDQVIEGKMRIGNSSSTVYSTIRTIAMAIPDEWKIMGDLYNSAFIREDEESIKLFEQVENELKSLNKPSRDKVIQILNKIPTPPRGKNLPPPGEKPLAYKGNKTLKSNKCSKEHSLCCASAGTARVSKKESNPEEKQTNPEKENRLTSRFKQFSSRLHEIVTAHRKITRAARPAGWVNIFRLLHERDGIPLKRINTVLEWYADNIGGQYIPEAYSANSFREKFPKLEAAIERNSGKKKPSRQEKKQTAGNGAAPVPGKYGETGLYFWNYSNYCYDKDEKKVDTQHFTGWKKHPKQYDGPCGCDWCKKKGVADLETITLTGGPHNDMDFQGYMERIEKENE